MGWRRLAIVGNLSGAQRELNWFAHDTLGRRAAGSLREAGILIAPSAQGERSGQRMQALGGWHICDRDSSHIRFQDAILAKNMPAGKLTTPVTIRESSRKKKPNMKSQTRFSCHPVLPSSHFQRWECLLASCSAFRTALNANDFVRNAIRLMVRSMSFLSVTSRFERDFPACWRHSLD
jgi:hypothetical protein